MTRHLRPSLLHRAFAALLAAAVALLGCPTAGPLAPRAGLLQIEERALRTVPGGLQVQVMGGSLRLHRIDLEIDTRLGPVKAGAHYDSAAARWFWSFETRYDGRFFVDPTGARHDVGALPDGAAIPGTTWVRLDAVRLRTKGGRVHVFQSGRLRAVHWASAAWPRLEVEHADAAGAMRPVAVRQCLAPGDCTPVFDLSYDAAGELAAVADRAGRVATFVHQGGRLVEARDALDRARGWPGTRYAYDAAGRLTARVSSEGERVEVAYLDGRVDLVRGVGAGDPEVGFAYEAPREGLYATRVTDPLGHVTVYRYDGRRRLHEVEDVATGAQRRTAWSGLRPTLEVAVDGTATAWTWADDDPVTRTDPSGNTVHFTWAPGAEDREDPTRRPLAAVRDDLGLVERRSYDAAGRLVEVRNGEDEVILSQTWQADGCPASRSTPGGRRDFGPCGPHGHPLSVRVDGSVWEIRYDAVGNRLWGLGDGPEPGGLVRRVWDEDRNLAGLVLESPATAGFETVAIAYRSDGQRLAVRRPHGGDHEMVYDALGRLVAVRERAEDAWHTTVIERDLAGRPIAVERPNGMRQEVDRDALGRVTARRWLQGGVLESEALFTWQAGRLTQILDSTHGAPELFAYDAAGRRTLTVFPDGGVQWLEHDLRSRPVRETLERGAFTHVAERAWDRADRERLLVENGEVLVSRHWQEGRLVRVDTGNGLSRHFTWDAATGALTGSLTEDATGAVVEETSVTREPVGSVLTGVLVSVDTTTARGVAVHTAEDHLLQPLAPGPQGEPVGRRITLWADATGASRTYAFDALSHRMDSGDASFAWGPQRRRLRAAAGPESGGAPVAYVTDAAGFVVERGGVPLGWTASGRLARWGDRVAFEWDALERPVRTTVDGGVRRFLFGGRVEADAQGNPLAMELGDMRIDLTDGSRLYRHRDFRRNVKFTTDDAGRVVTHYAYHPYGVHAVHGDGGDPVRFAGGTDLGGLTMIGVRVFDPLASRFLSPDPVFQLIDDFEYTLGNPIEFGDLDGRKPSVNTILTVAATVGLAAGAAGLFVVVSPAGAVIAGVSFGVASFGWAWQIAVHASQVKIDDFRSTIVQGSASDATPGTCSPTGLATLPRLPGSPALAVVWLLVVWLALRCRRHG